MNYQLNIDKSDDKSGYINTQLQRYVVKYFLPAKSIEEN